MAGQQHPLVVALEAAVDGVVEAVERAAAGLGELSQDDALGLLPALVAQADRLTVASARLCTSVDDDAMWATDGARSFAHWLAGCTGMPFVRARELVATGRALRDHLPATQAAALAGEIGTDQVRTMVKVAATSDARREALAAPAEECGEEFLVEHAKQNAADAFRRIARRWAAAADPESDERGYQDACDRELVTLAATTDGYHLSGFLTTVHGAAVNAALDAVMTAPAADDRRTTQQRRAQGLADLARLVLDHGIVGTGGAVRPHLSVVVDFETLRRAVEGEMPAGRRAGSGSSAGDRLFRLAPVADVERFAVAEVLGAGPIPPSVLARLACDSAVSRVVFGPDSQAINVGRAERTYAGPRRKAVIARDATCRYPGCTAPPALGEIHHVAQWSRDHGDTDVNTGVLLCWHHHDVVHRQHLEICPSPSGGWLFRTRHGEPLGARPTYGGRMPWRTTA